MKKLTNNLQKIKGLYSDLCISLMIKASDTHKAMLFILGGIIFFAVSAENAHAGSGTFGQACNKMLLLIEGAFGALVAAAAGVAAIIAAALGGFKMAWALVVVAVGSFVLRSFITIFNGVCG